MVNQRCSRMLPETSHSPLLKLLLVSHIASLTCIPTERSLHWDKTVTALSSIIHRCMCKVFMNPSCSWRFSSHRCCLMKYQTMYPSQSTQNAVKQALKTITYGSHNVI